jgi:hypothetical protein
MYYISLLNASLFPTNKEFIITYTVAVPYGCDAVQQRTRLPMVVSFHRPESLTRWNSLSCATHSPYPPKARGSLPYRQEPAARSTVLFVCGLFNDSFSVTQTIQRRMKGRYVKDKVEMI